MQRERHTLKHSLTDARHISGIGSAYADEILHRVRLSPIVRTERLQPNDLDRLHGAIVAVITEWSGRLRAEVGDEYPKVTAFYNNMAVHSKFGSACPVGVSGATDRVRLERDQLLPRLPKKREDPRR